MATLVAFGNVYSEVSIIFPDSFRRLFCVVIRRVVLLTSIIGPVVGLACLGAGTVNLVGVL